MAWDETLFKKIWHWVAAFKAPPDGQSESVALREIHPRLTLLARMLTGSPIELMRAEQEGGCAGQVFFLPEQINLGLTFEAHVDFYVFRVCYLAIQYQLEHWWSDAGARNVLESREKSRAMSAEVWVALQQSYPLAGKWQHFWADFPIKDPSDWRYWLLWGHWMSAVPVATATVKTSTALKQEALQSALTSLEAPAREHVEITVLDKQAMQAYTLQHQFEKVDTLEEFQGTWRQADGSDELMEHAEALQEVNLRKLVRCDDVTHSVLQADFLSGLGVPEVTEQASAAVSISYDEWDGRKRSYRQNWCKVYPQVFQERNNVYVQQTRQAYGATFAKLQRRFSYQFNAWQVVSRQTHGEEPDLDAMVESFAERQAGRVPSERLYLSQRRNRRELSLLLLLDLSLSTDGYTGGQRILDVAKQSVILFGDLLNQWHDRFQIDGFASHTRNQCEYLNIKSFDEPWGNAAARVGALEPRGYTRIGPALRHATSLLKRESSRSRWILLLSDGKPNDYDRYEGGYGLADVRQAIKEAQQQDIQTYALAIEALARNYLPQMLGVGGYRILPTPALLPEALADFYGRLLRH